MIVALSSGTIVLCLEKGTPLHRRVGRVYLGSMAVTTVGSFWIMELREGQPSVFHAVSAFVALLVLAGVIAIRSGQVWLHALLMTCSLLLTVITGVAQFFDQLPLSSAALNAIVFLQAPMVVGFTLIWRRSMKLKEASPSSG